MTVIGASALPTETPSAGNPALSLGLGFGDARGGPGAGEATSS